MLRDGWHTCPTRAEIIAGLFGAFLAGLVAGAIGVILKAVGGFKP